MTAVKRAEEARGWNSVMDNDSQQACGRAQPQALDSSPGEAEELPAWKTPHKLCVTRVGGVGGGPNIDVNQRNKVTWILQCVYNSTVHAACVFV